jgi:hypothetical protein
MWYNPLPAWLLLEFNILPDEEKVAPRVFICCMKQPNQLLVHILNQFFTGIGQNQKLILISIFV